MNFNFQGKQIYLVHPFSPLCFFFLFLQRYNGYLVLSCFRYATWYIYIWQNDPHNTLTYITTHTYKIFFLVMGILRYLLLATFKYTLQIYSVIGITPCLTPRVYLSYNWKFPPSAICYPFHSFVYIFWYERIQIIFFQNQFIRG